ncbi:Carboxypeptidase regulatory-like domain-containing protein [Bryocella elongata]|uniref:Carboxypeptidase regulatory-like domain-containing protein n=1 Tax=Bryocella elongata TaxID=863522 RepID=A0A1H5UTH3_9BACT|nr:TonB-dependent receptor [Bryocella elongata]SEF78270.1 Carboxypeptidase regulatory-like domain-containing protein [Bryocella elongata]
MIPSVWSKPILACVLRMSVLLLAVLPAMRAHAQFNNGAIAGTLRDSSGAVIPNAAVTIRNVDTGVVTALKTNSDGAYEALALIPGSYTVEATAQGFNIAKTANVDVHVKTRAQVDLTLSAGAHNEVVEVNSAALALQTESADVGNVVGKQEINDLPLNGRRYSDLALLEPGIFKDPSAANPAADRFSSNGNLELQNYFALDGIDNNSGSENLQEGSVQNVQPPPDAIQEFRLQTRTYSTEWGNSAGAVVNATTKSGTNQFHGDVWEFVRNSAMDANSWVNKHGSTVLPKGHFSQNQFGGTIGGPIKRDRIFFFGDYQGLLSSTADTVLSVIPTAAMRTGDLSELSSHYPQYHFAPTQTSQTGCITNNVIASNCIDPVAKALMALMPNPNNVTSSDGKFDGSNNYVNVYQAPAKNNSFDGRVDETINSKNTLFGRYSFLQQHRQDPPWTGNLAIGNGGFATDYNIRNQSLALGLTTVPTSSIVNQARFGWTRDSAHSNPIGVTLGQSAASSIGLNGIPSSPYTGGLPPFNISGGFRRIGVDLYRPQFQAAQVWQAIDNLTMLKGNHSLMFGYEYRRDTLNFFDLAAPQGYMAFTGLFSSTNGFGMADFLLGNVAQTIYDSQVVVHNFLYGHSFYGQDTWRVSPKFTLNYGARYELFSPWLNHNNRLANFSTTGGGSIYTAANGGWLQRSTLNPDKNNVAPRVGFSYQAFPKLVFRGGYGVFYQFVNRIGSESQLGQNQPFLTYVLDSRTTTASTPVFQLQNGFPGATYANSVAPLYIQKTNWQDQNQRTSYIQQFSFGPQFQLTPSTVAEAVYVGNLGSKMNRLRNANQGQVTAITGGAPTVVFPYANLNSGGTHAFLEESTDDGVTNYQGLELSLKRQMSHGWSYQVSYTWAHNFSDFADNLTAGSTPQNAYDYEHEYSQAPIDQRNRFVASTLYRLPIGKGGLVLNNDSKAASLIGGWQVNAIVTMQAGLPFSITAVDNSQTGGSHAAYANCTGDAFSGTTRNRQTISTQAAAGTYLNIGAFSQPSSGTFGSCRPRGYAGSGSQNVDGSLFKQFGFTDVRKLELRFEFFNLFNHANFANPGSAINSPATFGKVSSVVNTARQVQMAAKFYF